MKKILTASIWIISLWVCLIFSFLFYDSLKEDVVISIISFIIMAALIFLKITVCLSKNKKEAKIEILDSIFILSLFFFLLLRNHINFGYGNTLGILGYYRQIGILSMIGVSRTAAFIGLCISCAVLCLTILFKYSLAEKIPGKFKKSIIITVLIFGVIIEIIGINIYFSVHRLSGVFILSVIFYIALYFILNIILKKTKGGNK